MKHILITALLLAAAPVAAPVAAEAPMTAAEFDAYTNGKTLTFSRAGKAYGIEEYFDDRRVRWSFLDGQCQEGLWYEEDNKICFVYELEPSPQCWRFTRSGGGLRADFDGSDEALELYETSESKASMTCLGPDVGV